jgi:Tol biopolymer transport system component
MLVAGAAGGSAAQPSPYADELIAYQGNGKIYLIGVDGRGRHPLVSGASDQGLAWSPDGRQLAFTAGKERGRYDKTEIRIAAADGSGVRLLTRGPSHTASNPTWSPDGKRIAFDAWNGREERDSIDLINADGTGLRQLTRSGDNVWLDWSPDGRWIAFDRYIYTTKGDYTSTAALMAIHQTAPACIGSRSSSSASNASVPTGLPTPRRSPTKPAPARPRRTSQRSS